MLDTDAADSDAVAQGAEQPKVATTPATEITFTPRHYQRLRFYFRGRKGAGGVSRTDLLDLDLAAAGLITREESYGLVLYRISHAGEVELNAESKREIERRRPHHDLGGRLAQWLQGQGRITWENVEFTSIRTENGRVLVRPDVFSMEATLEPSQMRPQIHEVKVTRADFLADVKNEKKRGGNLIFCDAFYYAAPSGLIKPEEVPDGCGLVIEHSPCEFEILVRPKRRKVELDARTFLNLILKPSSAKPL
jgi:hypothetical protein